LPAFQPQPPQAPVPVLALSEALSIPEIMEFIKQKRANLQKLGSADAEIRARIQKIKGEISEELAKI